MHFLVLHSFFAFCCWRRHLFSRGKHRSKRSRSQVSGPSQSQHHLHFLWYYRVNMMFHIYFFSFIFISWRLITLQYCSGFCPCFIFKLYTQLTHNRKIIQLGSTHSYEHIKRRVFSSWLQIGSQILEAWGKFEPPAAAVMWQSLWDWPKA